MLRTSTSLAIAATALLAPSGAAAQAGPGATLYGGGTIADRVPTLSVGPAVASTAVGLRKAMDGKRIGVRVSISLPCGRYAGGGWRSTDVLTSAPLAGDGTFHLHGRKLRTTDVGALTLDIDGKLAPTRADGTTRVRTHFPCGAQVRPWTARPIDNFQPGLAAPAPADGVLYGVTDQDVAQNGTPHGLVAKVDDGGTSIHLYTSYTSRCRGVDRKGRYTATIRYQALMQDTPLGPAGFQRRISRTETPAQRRRQLDNYSLTVWQGGFRGPVLFGDRGKCQSGTERFSAVA